MAVASMSRSVYLSKLRRAFLLRVHPDRFRNESAAMRRDQASVVKALADRLVEPDFIAWQQHKCQGNKIKSANSKGLSQSTSSIVYRLERRDGTFLQTRLPLGGSVQDILKNITESLGLIGAYSLPSLTKLDEDGLQKDESNNSKFHSNRQRNSQHQCHNAASSSAGINHQYDIRSRQGRDLQQFLSTLSQNTIQERRLDRTDAQAAAMQVRSVFQFQSVDATSLGWSSASVAVLLNQLLALYEEFSSKLHVQSFYPIQLLFTSDDFHAALDLHGGVLRLNPSLTKLQWLEKLQLVTEESIDAVHYYRAEIVGLAKRAQSLYHLSFKKGYSCSSRDYYEFLCSICSAEVELASYKLDNNRENKSLAMTPLTATVESEYVCRRPMVTREGSIRLGAGMDTREVTAAAAKFCIRARDQETVAQKEREQCADTIRRIQWELGVERIYKNRTVHESDFVDCLSRIVMAQEDEQKNMLKSGLTGNALGVASSGAFCHLADDGAIVIPVDWR
ncbi:hypothetical protein MPSEU_000100500 [Mayamaea pseudoterrestris]|nr:hypothetical protein MPSEU_000100500 [Mayamaea pseudoterrestris]